MFENIIKFFKKLGKKEEKKESSDTAKERLHLVLMQDRANVSADFLELMKQEIIEVIKKYIDIDEKAIDVRLTNKTNDDGTVGAPALYANIPIVTIKNEARIANVPHEKKEVSEQTSQSKQVSETKIDNAPVENNTTDTAEKSKKVEENDKTDNEEKNDKSEKVIEEAKKIQNEIEEENKIESDEIQEKVAEEISLEENQTEEKIEKEGLETQEEEKKVRKNA